VELNTNEAYSALIEKARWSHDNNRNVFSIEPDDIARARLYAYGYRTQTIGAFHGAREALENAPGEVNPYRMRAIDTLEQLGNQALLLVPDDARVVISTLFYYDKWTRQTIEAMEADCADGAAADIEPIKQRFADQIQRVCGTEGIYVSDDVTVPEQASFIVPNLKIIIVPVNYGDRHSWNFAFLTPESAGVTTHLHKEGVEIHLGFSPVYGRTILRDHGTVLREGYAMPIPPRTKHGFDNLSGHEHGVPFIFGSMTLTGWGVFFDVEPQPTDSSTLTESPLDSEEMNRSVYLEREIDQMKKTGSTSRRVLVPAASTDNGVYGGLELEISRVDSGGLDLSGPEYRIVSVRSGRGAVKIGPATAELSEHDHVGVPAGMDARIAQSGDEPLVILESTIKKVKQ
jgi:hypothetical protein